MSNFKKLVQVCSIALVFLGAMNAANGQTMTSVQEKELVCKVNLSDIVLNVGKVGRNNRLYATVTMPGFSGNCEVSETEVAHLVQCNLPALGQVKQLLVSANLKSIALTSSGVSSTDLTVTPQSYDGTGDCTIQTQH